METAVTMLFISIANLEQCADINTKESVKRMLKGVNVSSERSVDTAMI